MEKLSSKSHFSIGVVGARPYFADRSLTLKQLKDDFKASKEILIDPSRVRIGGSKCYLITSGWKGKVFNGDVTFYLVQGVRGWEWNGVLGAISFEDMRKFITAEQKEPPQPEKYKEGLIRSGTSTSISDLRIKSPWPEGRFFRAGGLWKYVEEQTAVATIPFPWNMIVLSEFANRPCGWGPAGYYYNQGPTHSSNRDRFSIDFMSYGRGVPYDEITTNTPVLAVSRGIVNFVREWVPSGSTVTDNRVVIDHYTDEELIMAIIVGLFTDDPIPRSCYSARYLHLAGPSEVPVSVGMYVEQGRVLGRMDDTGNSAGSHLHFSMHDNNNNFSGVRPTPMDGQTLQDWEDGKCMYSTNTPIF